MTTLESGFLARALRPRYGIVHLAFYTILLVLGAAVLGFVVVRQQISSELDQIGVFVADQVAVLVAESPIPEVLIVQDPLVASPGAYLQDYDFTNDWFSPNIPHWEAALSSFKGRPDIQYLEIGLWEGRSALWMLENILTHPTARMTGLDIFDSHLSGSLPLPSSGVKERYFANINLSGAADKVTTIIDFSQVALRKLPLDSFDIVYIDGSHDENDVFEDAALSWRLLKEGGILIFDDYLHVRHFPDHNIVLPMVAIDAFYRSFERQLEVIHKSNQLVLRKKNSPE